MILGRFDIDKTWNVTIMISLHATDKLPLANYFYLEINVFVATDICIPQYFVSIYEDFKPIDNEYYFHHNISIYL